MSRDTTAKQCKHCADKNPDCGANEPSVHHCGGCGYKCCGFCIAERSLATTACGKPAVSHSSPRPYRFKRTFHGMHGTPEYKAFINARARCTQRDHKSYPDYGGRGVQFLLESPRQILELIGPRPSPKHSLDRIDTYGHYEPGNIRWATRLEQQQNRRNGNADMKKRLAKLRTQPSAKRTYDGEGR